VINPFKKIDQLCDTSDHHSVRLNCAELFQHSANGRLTELEKNSASAETVRWCVAELTALQKRVESLEKRTAPPAGVELPGAYGVEDGIKATLRAASGPLTVPEIQKGCSARYKTVSARLSEMARRGEVVRVRHGLYTLPSPPPFDVRSLAARNGGHCYTRVGG
jgi:hypothetical protein